MRRAGLWSGGGWFASCLAAVVGDDGVPALPGDDDGVKVTQDGGGEDGLGLGGPELVVLAAGQVPVAGGVDGVGALRSPDRPPGGQA